VPQLNIILQTFKSFFILFSAMPLGGARGGCHL